MEKNIVNDTHSAEVKKQLEDILSDDEYQVYYREHEASLLAMLEEFVERYFGNLLRKMFPQSEIPEHLTSWIAYILMAVCLVVLVGMLVSFYRKLVPEMKYKPGSAGSEEDFSMSVETHLEAADQYARNGDYREAIRRLFLAMLLRLDEKQWIQARAWKSNGEYCDELLDSAPEYAQRFREVSAVFDETFFGGRRMAQQEYHHFRMQVEKVMKGGFQ